MFIAQTVLGSSTSAEEANSDEPAELALDMFRRLKGLVRAGDPQAGPLISERAGTREEIGVLRGQDPPSLNIL
jgi:hypothetical protein